MVPKASSPSSYRVCGDFRALNAATNMHSLPRIQNFFVSLRDKFIFAKKNLVRAYHQIPMEV